MFKKLYKFWDKWNSNKNTEYKFVIIARTISTILVLFTLLIIVIERTNIWGVGNKVWHLKFFNHFFVDGDNKFNWIGISSVLAIISLTFTAWDSRRKLKADLVSKSRVAWIENVRKNISDLYGFYATIITYGPEDLNNGSNLMKQIYETKTNIKANTEKFCLFFGMEKSNTNVKLDDTTTNAGKNAQMIGLVRDIEKEYIEKLDEFYNTLINGEGNVDYMVRFSVLEENVNLKINIENLTKYIGIYLKIEWNRAKRGE